MAVLFFLSIHTSFFKQGCLGVWSGSAASCRGHNPNFSHNRCACYSATSRLQCDTNPGPGRLHSQYFSGISLLCSSCRVDLGFLGYIVTVLLEPDSEADGLHLLEPDLEADGLHLLEPD